MRASSVARHGGLPGQVTRARARRGSLLCRDPVTTIRRAPGTRHQGRRVPGAL